MAKQKWTIKGRLLFEPQMAEIREEYGERVPLAGVRLQVSAKEIKADPKWQEWGDVYLSPNGTFTITENKDKTPRYFRIRVMFKDKELKLYPASDGLVSKAIDLATSTSIVSRLTEELAENALSWTTRLTYDVDWYTIRKTEEKEHRKGPGTVDFGDMVFRANGHLDLGKRTARRHAEIWWLAKKLIEKLEGIGHGFPDKKPLAIKHPHNEPLIGDGIEASYANPMNNVAHICENSKSDHFNAETILHELMHLWAYQHSTREKGLAWQLIIHGSTHEDRQNKTWVAFHEAFAEWAGNQIYASIFNRFATIYGDSAMDSRPVPFSRDFLKGLGISSYSQLDHYEMGWITLFNAIIAPDLEDLEPDSGDVFMRFPGSRAFRPGGTLNGGANPGLADVLKVFKAHPARGYDKILKRSEMALPQFLDRAVACNPDITAERRRLIEQQLETRRPVSSAATIRPLKEPPLEGAKSKARSGGRGQTAQRAGSNPRSGGRGQPLQEAGSKARSGGRGKAGRKGGGRKQKSRQASPSGR